MVKFFTPESPMVKSALLYFSIGIFKEINDVPDLFDLRDVVAGELAKLN